MSRHILITGGAGFIGSHVVDRLLEEGGWNITVLDNFDPFYARAVKEENVHAHKGRPDLRLIEGDILDDAVLEKVAGSPWGPPERILHMAAKAGVRPSLKDPISYHRVNVSGTLNLLEFARHLRVPHFVLASSSSVYGLDPEVPWKEKMQGLQPISPYAATKIAAEQFAQVYAHLHGVQVTALRFFTVYGPRQRPDLAIHQFFRKIAAGTPIQQFGDGGTERDYTWVGDIVAGVRAALDRKVGGPFEVYNLGNHQTIRLSGLIGAIEDVLGRKAVIERLPEQPGDLPRTLADIDKAGRDLGYRPSTDLREGLERFHAWFKEKSPVAS